jgi:hypothetical protein
MWLLYEPKNSFIVELFADTNSTKNKNQFYPQEV